MVLVRIEKLLNKYENGQTTLDEEVELRDYFSQSVIASQFEVYRPLFNYFEVTCKEKSTADISLQTNSYHHTYKWLATVAMIVIAVTIFTKTAMSSSLNFNELTEDQLIVFNQTRKAMDLLANNINKGSEGFNALTLMSKSLNKGAENIFLLESFTETKNKIFKINN